MAFTLKSGNSPKFKNIGSTTPAKNMKTGSYAHSFEDDSQQTPAYLNEFGIGEGTSPLDQPGLVLPGFMARKLGAKLGSYLRNKDEAENTEAENNGEENTETKNNGEENNETKNGKGNGNTSDLKTSDEISANKEGEDIKNLLSGLGKPTLAAAGANVAKGVITGAKNVAGKLFQGFTHGTDAVYGTGKYKHKNKAFTFSGGKNKDIKGIEEKIAALTKEPGSDQETAGEWVDGEFKPFKS